MENKTTKILLMGAIFILLGQPVFLTADPSRRNYSPDESERLRNKCHEETERWNRIFTSENSYSTVVWLLTLGATATTALAAQGASEEAHKEILLEAVADDAEAFIMNEGQNPSSILQATLNEVRKASSLLSDFEIKNASEMTDLELSYAILKSLGSE